MIWAVVLAAGESKRMGKPKLLLPFRGKTIIEAVVENLVGSSVDATLVVLGSNWEKVAEQIKSHPVKTTVNPHFQSGMLSSVQWGIKKIPAGARAVLIVLADQPAIHTDIINLVVQGYEKSGKGIVLPVFKKARGHPLLIDMKYRKEIQGLDPDIGLRSLISIHPDDVLEVAIQSSSVLRDIDNEEDYAQELEDDE